MYCMYYINTHVYTGYILAILYVPYMLHKYRIHDIHHVYILENYIHTNMPYIIENTICLYMK